MADVGLAPPEAGRVTAARAGDAATEIGGAAAITLATAAALTGTVHSVVVAVLLAVVAALGFDAWRFVRRDDLPPTVERLLLGHDGALRGAVGAAGAWRRRSRSARRPPRWARSWRDARPSPRSRR